MAVVFGTFLMGGDIGKWGPFFPPLIGDLFPKKGCSFW